MKATRMDRHDSNPSSRRSTADQIAFALRASGDHRQVGVREVIKRDVGKRIGMGWAEANHACNVLPGWSWSIEF